jgi:hypothetical protein
MSGTVSGVPCTGRDDDQARKMSRAVRILFAEVQRHSVRVQYCKHNNFDVDYVVETLTDLRIAEPSADA